MVLSKAPKDPNTFNVHDVIGNAQQQIGHIGDHQLAGCGQIGTKPDNQHVQGANDSADDHQVTELTHFAFGQMIHDEAGDGIVNAVKQLGDQEQGANCCRIHAANGNVVQCQEGCDQVQNRGAAHLSQHVAQLLTKAYLIGIFDLFSHDS